MARCEGPWRATPSVVAVLILVGLALAPAPADDDARLVLDLRCIRDRLLKTGANLSGLLKNPDRTEHQVLTAQRLFWQDVKLLESDLQRVKAARAAHRPICSEAAAIVAQCLSLCEELKDLQRELSGKRTPDLGASPSSVARRRC